MAKSISSFLLFICFFILSCEKPEIAVTKQDRGEVVSAQVEMGSDYRHQIWFSLSGNTILSSNFKTDWDLAFETTADGYLIFLNTSKAMRVLRTPYTNFNQLKDTIGLAAGGRVDGADGNRDSTAIGDWRNTNKVYLISAGYNESGIHQGFFKMKFVEVNNNAYRIELAALNAEVGLVYTIEKFTNSDKVYFSIQMAKQVQIEPESILYDFCFTQYTHTFYDPFQFYQVTGVLMNHTRMRVIKIQDKKFQEISITDTVGRQFSNKADAVGYDWKTFDLNTNLFTVNPSISYIIQDVKGYFYKLHFIDFYNSSGIKGYPKFEYKKL